jgi:hypothetical protein
MTGAVFEHHSTQEGTVGFVRVEDHVLQWLVPSSNAIVSKTHGCVLAIEDGVY